MSENYFYKAHLYLNSKEQSADSSLFIDSEELQVLKDIEDLCKFTDKNERRSFHMAVSEACSCNQLDKILKKDFDIAIGVARRILRRRGEAIFLSMMSKRSEK